jgi:hypothetical protein
MRVAAVNLLEMRSAYRMLVEKCYENCHLEDRVGGGCWRITLRTILEKNTLEGRQEERPGSVLC